MLSSLHINYENKVIQSYLSHYTSVLFYKSSLFENNEYDQYINEWMGHEYKWKLLYKSSEHEYSAGSFHEYCDDKGPTITIIKSDEGWIFGGFTRKSWNGDDECKNDSKSFIFTLKNPYNVPPTKYNKLQNSKYSIHCNSYCGPIFCGSPYRNDYDIFISNNCNKPNSCYIDNDGTKGYECDPQYRKSLFVNTDTPDKRNRFNILDYEVYCIDDYYSFLKNEFKFYDLIWDYIQTKQINSSLLYSYYHDHDIYNEFMKCDIRINFEIQNIIYKYYNTPSTVLQDSHIVSKEYDQYINEWIGDGYKWKLLYRTSEYDYTASSFQYVYDIKPILIIIKSTEGWIFGGFTSKSFSGDFEESEAFYIDDSKAFIFTLKNPHNVPPTKYNKIKDGTSFKCDYKCGPLFGDNNKFYFDIFIGNNCNISNSCSIDNDGEHGYECDPQYRKSLFVNTAKPDKRNWFSVLDYEVYSIDNYDDYVKNEYKCGELISNYTENNIINIDLIPKDYSEHDLLCELEDLKIVLNSESQCLLFKYYYTPSNVLQDSHIVSKEYDQYINEWIGTEYQWKLLYRASEHEYTGKSFHEYCNDKGPTIVIIKNSYGWIFGGYTTKSWNVQHSNTYNDGERKDDSSAFIFTLKNPHNVPPTKYNKRKESKHAILCDSECGPVFCSIYDSSDDISICNRCNQSEKCYIDNDGENGYECDPQYRSSLFVNTDEPDERNRFSVLDYEVYSIENYDDYVKNEYKCGELRNNYIKNNILNADLIPKDYSEHDLLCELDDLKIMLHCKSQDILFNYYYNPSNILINSHIVDRQYDKYINEWIRGSEYSWKLIYRSSEHEYSADSFHEYCNDKGPTLIIIKSSYGWIFGGYTSKSWCGNNDYKNDSNAFIFTLKNPHNVPPTKYNKRKESKRAILCDSEYGPVFYYDHSGYSDICINNNCNQSYSCKIDIDGTHGYECDPQYRSSLFVNTDKPDKRNMFNVLDYEVYTIDNYNDYLKNEYKCGKLIYNYIKNKIISADLIPTGCDEHNLLHDFEDCEITLNNESQHILFNYYYTPSNLLINSHIVDRQYDQYINEWMGYNYSWKLLYRASEHEYTAKSFHEYCDDKGPTLIIIKSSCGWIFGGYTTQSWKNTSFWGIKDDSKAFIFTLKNPHHVPPTKYYKRKESEYAIQCSHNRGPIFYGSRRCSDISINNKCNESNSCYIDNDGNHGYEGNSQYLSSLFVNTAEPDKRNWFSVLDYEVYVRNQ